MRRVFAIGVAALALTGAAPARWTPVFTAQQAQDGARVYAVRCAMCHGARLQGSVEIPGLTGRFVVNWAGRPIGDLYSYVSTAMPQQAPGSLTPEDNVKLLAFLLERNGAPSGSAALQPESPALRRQMFAAAPPGR